MGRSVENRAGGGRALTGWTPVLARQKWARGIMLFISGVIEEAKGDDEPVSRPRVRDPGALAMSKVCI